MQTRAVFYFSNIYIRYTEYHCFLDDKENDSLNVSGFEDAGTRDAPFFMVMFQHKIKKCL